MAEERAEERVYLIVKGNQRQGQKALDAHGIKAGFSSQQPVWGNTSWYAGSDDLRKIVDWYCEPAMKPFEPGTLLWYRS